MISRRNIRIKVMQTLYTVSLESETTKKPSPDRILEQHFDETRTLLVYLTWFMTEVARYAEIDAHQKASKHLPTASDLQVNTKIAGNEYLWKMLDDPALKGQFEKIRPELLLKKWQTEDMDMVKKIYQQLAESDTYRDYINDPVREKVKEKKVLEFILNDLLLANEFFLSHIEENFSNWDDDGEMVVQLLVAYLNKPGSYDFNEMLSPDKAKFARELLRTVIEKNEHLLDLIKPKLKNWDPERIAILDMILMKMGVAEFLYFETIPPKVTINEYIDLAKDYSTAQSGQFVNGILDNIHKDLVQDGSMKKVDFKK